MFDDDGDAVHDVARYIYFLGPVYTVSAERSSRKPVHFVRHRRIWVSPGNNDY